VAVGEEVLAVDRFNRKDNASRGDGSLQDVGRGRWLDNMRRSVAYGAVRVGQPIRMIVCLLDSDAEEEKDGAQDGEHETFACFPVVAYSSHDSSILYSSELNGTSQSRRNQASHSGVLSRFFEIGERRELRACSLRVGFCGLLWLHDQPLGLRDGVGRTGA
jgi:hypothetical protein